MGGAGSTHGERRMHTNFYSKNLKKKTHLRYSGIDEKITLKHIFEK
jgi:hypothetical protein